MADAQSYGAGNMESYRNSIWEILVSGVQSFGDGNTGGCFEYLRTNSIGMSGYLRGPDK